MILVAGSLMLAAGLVLFALGQVHLRNGQRQLEEAIVVREETVEMIGRHRRDLADSRAVWEEWAP